MSARDTCNIDGARGETMTDKDINNFMQGALIIGVIIIFLTSWIVFHPIVGLVAATLYMLFISICGAMGVYTVSNFNAVKNAFKTIGSVFSKILPREKWLLKVFPEIKMWEPGQLISIEDFPVKGKRIKKYIHIDAKFVGLTDRQSVVVEVVDSRSSQSIPNVLELDVPLLRRVKFTNIEAAREAEERKSEKLLSEAKNSYSTKYLLSYQQAIHEADKALELHLEENYGSDDLSEHDRFEIATNKLSQAPEENNVTIPEDSKFDTRVRW